MDRRDRSYGGGEKKTCGQERGAQGAEEGDDGDEFDDTVCGDNGDDNGDYGHLDCHTIAATVINIKQVDPQMWEKYQKMAGSQPKQNKSLESLLGGRKLRGFVNAINSKVRN